MAYITIGVFLAACGLLLWFFPDTAIIEYGYAELGSFFSLVPFLFIFLIPAICMRSFAEERKEGTYVLLATRPLSDWQILFGKYLACLALVGFALLPTLVYYFSVYQLGYPKGNIDTGAVIGSYIGLFLLGSAFVSLGLCASSLTKNQVVAFALAAFFCFLTFSGFQSASAIFALDSIGSVLENLGIETHYKSISRGVLDARDLAYFISFNALFLGLTRLLIGGRRW